MNDEFTIETRCDKCGCKVYISSKDSCWNIKCDDCKDDEKDNR